MGRARTISGAEFDVWRIPAVEQGEMRDWWSKEIPEWVHRALEARKLGIFEPHASDYYGIGVQTGWGFSYGNSNADDWIICAPNGQVYPCKDELFKQLFMPSSTPSVPRETSFP